MAKKIKSFGGLIFSTDPDFKIEEDKEEAVTLPPGEQLLKVSLQTKHRAGKTVTLITGFVGQLADAETLGKQLRNYCGAGGTAKADEIIVQGDHREKVMHFLSKNGYTKAKKS